MDNSTEIGRPTVYTPDLGALICERLATTDRGVKDICNDPDMPGKTTIWRWLSKYPDFWDKYTRARDFQTEQMYDEMSDIANMPLTHNGKTIEEGGQLLYGAEAMAEVQRRKLIIDVLKFKLTKLQPKRFGDNKNVNMDVNVKQQVSAEQFKELLAAACAAPKEIEEPYSEYEEVK